MESNRPALLKLCWMINQQLKAELAYNRAQWRTSYYRKLKAKLENSSKTSERWSDHTELSKKIESCRLNALKKQEDLMKTNKRQQKDMAAATKQLESIVTHLESKVAGLSVPFGPYSKRKWQHYTLEEIADMADQYEADRALERALRN
jgi:hypothetical protein